MSADKAKSIRALIDTLEKIPAERFGTGRARILRKLVLVAIAKYADADGTNAMPSVESLAKVCLVTKRAIYPVLEWFQAQGVLDIDYKAGRHGCNRYAIQFEPATVNTASQCTAVHCEDPAIHSEVHARHSEIENDILPSLDRPIYQTHRADEIPERDLPADLSDPLDDIPF